ncbi:hypothetical protein [Variovorax sp. Sphag1AA]|uniref:hypothetical protein n=1 Tax=Variovorax sp. Sphag1AA TaxID=2587027 RepID=UPI0016189344|nr:hypothetical protein [Variovorax sp. Sphag1AA]MBB3180434.1 hypothetical protein [Variovorax sp. Sphag1AA]
MLSFGAIALAGCGGGGGGGGGSAAALSAAAASAAQSSGSSAAGSGGVSSGGTTLGTTPQTVSFCGNQTDIVDSSLNIVASQYTAMAAQMGKDAGIAYRYGPDAVACGTANSGVDLYKRTDTKLTNPPRDANFFWSVGGPPSSGAGSYSTNQANMAYVADDPTQRVGVTDFQVSGYMYNVFAQLPQLSWTRGGIDSLNVLKYTQPSASNMPVAVGRCTGRSGFCNESLVVFQNGIIGTAGSNTANNSPSVQLPATKVPTGIALTNDSEFALVTVWDTQQLKGQVAVVALAGLCDGCYVDNPSGWYDWWNEWMGVYPGIPNVGNIAFMKILGYVDLPGMAAPTEIATTTGLDQFFTVSLNGYFLGRVNSPLTTYWQSFASGGSNQYAYAKGGVAVVISKSEQKAAFIDLKPLFSYFNSKYFSTSVTETTNLGQAANQWPYTFDQAPAAMPTVAKVVSLNARPTAVKTTVLERYNPRAWIATQDGTLHIFSLTDYAPGPSAATPSPNSIAEVGTVTGIGRNPTSLATSKGEPGANIEPLNEQVIVGSRGDNKISWVRFASNHNSGSVVRTIQHKEIKDLIAVEDSDNFANDGYVMSALDYTGKKVHNYRYGPVIFNADGGACPKPNGCPVLPAGAVAEYGGAMALPGKPFQMSSANVP